MVGGLGEGCNAHASEGLFCQFFTYVFFYSVLPIICYFNRSQAAIFHHAFKLIMEVPVLNLSNVNISNQINSSLCSF